MSTLTIYRELEQRSPEWYAARCGLVTASTVGRLITQGPPDPVSVTCTECSAPADEPCISLRGGSPIKTMHPARHALAASQPDVLGLADNETSRGLILTLAAERITGHAEDTPMTSDMWRGVMAEPIARDAYAESAKAEVEEIGFMVRHFDGCSIGWSPDGLVDSSGGIEIKAPRAKGHIQTVLDDAVPAQYMPQIQTALLVSGRAWCDFVSFHGGLHLWTKRVTADPAWQAAIKAAALHAEQQITDITERYRAATDGLPMTERIPDPYEEMVI